MYLLDDELNTQFRLTTLFESSVADTGGTARACQATWSLADVNADGHDDIEVVATCTETEMDELNGDGRPENTSAGALSVG